MSNELRDFAQSILRMDSERVMWWERAQSLAKSDSLVRQNERVFADVVTLIAERDAVIKERADAILSRDHAYADLASMTAQRDSWLAKSIALAEQLHALQSATPGAPVEVDGFRVGDLVCWKLIAHASDITWNPIESLRDGRAQYAPAWSTLTKMLARKPVEVGDTVRCVSGPFAGRTGVVTRYIGNDLCVQESPGGGSFSTAPSCFVAVAP